MEEQNKLKKRRTRDGWWVILLDGTPEGEYLKRFDTEKQADGYITWLRRSPATSDEN